MYIKRSLGPCQVYISPGRNSSRAEGPLRQGRQWACRFPKPTPHYRAAGRIGLKGRTEAACPLAGCNWHCPSRDMACARPPHFILLHAVCITLAWDRCYSKEPCKACKCPHVESSVS